MKTNSGRYVAATLLTLVLTGSLSLLRTHYLIGESHSEAMKVEQRDGEYRTMADLPNSKSTPPLVSGENRVEEKKVNSVSSRASPEFPWNRVFDFIYIYVAVAVGAFFITYVRHWGLNRTLHETGAPPKELNPFDFPLALATSVIVTICIFGFIGDQSYSFNLATNGFQMGMAWQAFSRSIAG